MPFLSTSVAVYLAGTLLGGIIGGALAWRAGQKHGRREVFQLVETRLFQMVGLRQSRKSHMDMLELPGIGVVKADLFAAKQFVVEGRRPPTVPPVDGNTVVGIVKS